MSCIYIVILYHIHVSFYFQVNMTFSCLLQKQADSACKVSQLRKQCFDVVGYLTEHRSEDNPHEWIKGCHRKMAGKEKMADIRSFPPVL